MKLLFISHKECWPDSTSPTGYATHGGFPFQVQAISRLFDQTSLLITQPNIPAPNNLLPLQGDALTISTVPPPKGGRWHKLNLLPWAWHYLPCICVAVARADAVHAAVPGDVGSLGLVIALLLGKPLFVRHCGTFGEPVTLSDYLLLWILERIAGGRCVVMATGGAESPPSKRNPNITWIFSTTLSRSEIDEIPLSRPWQPGEALRLVTVGRLTTSKNFAAIIEALPAIREARPECRLDILGEGECRSVLEAQAQALGVEQAITFHGNVTHAQVLKILSQSHLFVFPTQVKEGFPKAMLEALACGLPVVATRVSVIPRLLENGSGMLLDITNGAAVSRAVKAITADYEHISNMSGLARQAVKGYTLEVWGEAIEKRLRAAWGPLKANEA